jgi:putative ABC transport system ATP-binding protein
VSDLHANAAARPTESSGQPPVFLARDITKVYNMGEVAVHALRGISLDLFEAEFLVLLGPSGSGKSTLLNILGGLDVPTSGTVTYRGQNLTSADERALTMYRRKHVGFVFQFYNLIPSLTARENVALVTDIVDRPMAPAEALKLVKLGDRLDHFPSQLSGGEQQRVAIARAFSNSPRLLLADEPTGNLDSETGARIVELLETLNRESRTTIVLVTHDLVLARRAQRIIRLADGVVVSDAPSDSAAELGDDAGTAAAALQD